MGGFSQLFDTGQPVGPVGPVGPGMIEAKCSLDSTNFGDLSCLEEAASGCQDLRGGDGKTRDPKLTGCPQIFEFRGMIG